MMNIERVLNVDDRQYKLEQILNHVKNEFDCVIIDTPPGIGIMSMSSVIVSDKVIIPINTTMNSNKGLKDILGMVESLKKDFNKDIVIGGAFFTRYQAKKKLAKSFKGIVSDLCKDAGSKLYETAIRECEAVTQAKALCKYIFEYDPKSNAAIDYENLVKEILN